MSKGNTFESDLLLLIFNATPIANLADNAGTGPLGSLWVSLHTSDPGETGLQNASETSYTGYGRVAVTRSGAGWTVSGTAPTQVENAATITFGACTVGTPTITHFGIGVAVSGGTKLLYSGALTAPLAVSPGITPLFSAGVLLVTED